MQTLQSFMNLYLCYRELSNFIRLWRFSSYMITQLEMNWQPFNVEVLLEAKNEWPYWKKSDYCCFSYRKSILQILYDICIMERQGLLYSSRPISRLVKSISCLTYWALISKLIVDIEWLKRKLKSYFEYQNRNCPLTTEIRGSKACNCIFTEIPYIMLV